MLSGDDVDRKTPEWREIVCTDCGKRDAATFYIRNDVILCRDCQRYREVREAEKMTRPCEPGHPDVVLLPPRPGPGVRDTGEGAWDFHCRVYAYSECHAFWRFDEGRIYKWSSELP